MAKVTVKWAKGFRGETGEDTLVSETKDLIDDVITEDLARALGDAAKALMEKVVEDSVKKTRGKNKGTAVAKRHILARAYDYNMPKIREAGELRAGTVKQFTLTLFVRPEVPGANRHPKSKAEGPTTPPVEYASYYDAGFDGAENYRYVPVNAKDTNRHQAGDPVGIAIEIQGLATGNRSGSNSADFRKKMENTPWYQKWIRSVRAKKRFKSSMLSGRRSKEIKLHHIIPVKEIIKRHGSWVTDLDGANGKAAREVWMDENNLLAVTADEHNSIHGKYGWKSFNKRRESAAIQAGKVLRRATLAGQNHISSRDKMSFTVHEIAKDKWEEDKDMKEVPGPGTMVPALGRSHHPGFRGSHYTEVFKRRFDDLIKKVVDAHLAAVV